MWISGYTYEEMKIYVKEKKKNKCKLNKWKQNREPEVEEDTTNQDEWNTNDEENAFSIEI